MDKRILVVSGIVLIAIISLVGAQYLSQQSVKANDNNQTSCTGDCNLTNTCENSTCTAKTTGICNCGSCQGNCSSTNTCSSSTCTAKTTNTCGCSK